MTERKITVTVWETNAPVADSKWMACYDDYDLDCFTGTGHTPEEAIIELVSLHDLPKPIVFVEIVNNEIRGKTREEMGE